MDLATCISDLLYRYECVILPGFGAFLTQRQPATIKGSTPAFYPPQKVLSFNKQLQSNDGLLANYIANIETCSYTDALAKIQHFIANLNAEIHQGKRVYLHHIGTFFSSVENTLQFEPELKVNYLTESFGLSSFVTSEIQREIQRETYKEEVIELEEKAPIALTPEKRNDRPYLKYAAIAILALGIGIFGLKQYSNTVIAHNDAVALEVSSTIKTEVLEAGFIYESQDPLPAVSVLLQSESTLDEAIHGRYHIIAGAFRIPENAARKLAQLKTKGFNARLLGENAYGLHQVVYESHSDKHEALRQLRHIKRTNDYNAWLLVQDF